MQIRFFQIKMMFSNTFLASTNKISQISLTFSHFQTCIEIWVRLSSTLKFKAKAGWGGGGGGVDTKRFKTEQLLQTKFKTGENSILISATKIATTVEVWFSEFHCNFHSLPAFQDTSHTAENHLWCYTGLQINFLHSQALFIWSRVPEATLPLETTLRSVYMEL